MAGDGRRCSDEASRIIFKAWIAIVTHPFEPSRVVRPVYFAIKKCLPVTIRRRGEWCRMRSFNDRQRHNHDNSGGGCAGEDLTTIDAQGLESFSGGLNLFVTVENRSLQKVQV